MRILFVHEIDYRKKVIYEIHEFPELIAEMGHEVSFIDFPEQTKKDAFLSSKRTEDIVGRVYPSATLSLISPGWIGKGSLKRLTAMITFVPVFLSALSKNRPDVIVNYAIPTYGLQISIMSRLFRVPVIHRALDASHAIRESWWNPLIKLWERMVITLSNRVSANNPEMADYVRGLAGSSKIIEVHNPPLDLEHFDAVWELNPLKKELGLSSEDKTILYMGSFFYFSGLGDVLESLSKHVKKDPRIKLVLVGGGEQEAELRKKATELGVQDNVIFTGFVDYSVLPQYLKLADVAINPMIPLRVSDVALPHKVLQYLASGIPTVSTRLKGLERSLANEEAVRFVEKPSQVLDEAIELISSSGARNTQEDVKQYEKSIAAEKFLGFLQ